MHELSVCLALIEQVEQVAKDHGAIRVDRILLHIGPLSGVEPALLKSAFPLAAAGTLAASAQLDIEKIPIRVRCRDCDAESEVPPNRLLCAHCGGYHTTLLSGKEMLLANLELTLPEE